MTTITEYLAEQKRLAEDAQADSTSLKMNTDTGRWMISSSKRTIFAMDQLVDTVPRMIAALEAVVRMHFPYRGPGDRDTCGSEICSNLSWGPEPWPCPTVRAVEAALGGGGDE
ncbi:hypothetical protein MUN78_16445 [Leucobacter allii]|uniref:Uncharacterized protein n=1 Tax=Leucobacter allii TaxID=2932247 RepID=A0ABY4FLS8_9MICO|nr:hypothetical protein [Leucobacter allii]UOQ57220.1 hypothetical protein MUN78_16445 [Leucobacter allii]